MASARSIKQITRPESRTRQPKTAVLPYILLSILLFGRMKWVVRDGTGWVRSSTRNICPYLKTQPDHLKGCLKSLENWGLIRRFNWYRSWFEVELEIPQGMKVDIPAKKLKPSEDEPEMFLMIKHDETAQDQPMSGYDIDEDPETENG